MSSPSVERTVERTLVRAIVMVAGAIVAVSAVGTTAVVIGRDDGQARAQALTLGTELRDHRNEPPEALRELVRHELTEQSHFGRCIEVQHRGHALGARCGQARPQSSSEGCTVTIAQGHLARACAVRVDAETDILVVSPLSPLLRAQIPIFAAITASALLAALGFGVTARRLARRSLEPLQRFERAVASLPTRVSGKRLPEQWHAAEVDQLASTFNTLLERIDTAIAHEQRFVANAAHELRTPVTRLRGHLELALQEAPPTGALCARLTLALRSCLELGRSLEAILALSRSESLAVETLDLADIASEVLDNLTADERARVDAQLESAAVRGEAVLLGLALRNLLDNALKYSPGPVELHVGMDADTARVTVRDHGPGIAPAELPRVRKPFVRGPLRDPSVRGAGLGLALVDHVLLHHGGRLELANGDANAPGLVATLRLPPWRPEPLGSR